MKAGRGDSSREKRKARVLKESLNHPKLGRRDLARRLAAEGGPSEATIGKFLREEGLSQKSQRLTAPGQDPASSEPRLGEILYVARLPCEAGGTSSRSMLLGLDQASAFAFVSCDADSLSGSLEELVEKSSKMFGRAPGKVILDRNGNRYFKIPKAAEDFVKGRGISIQLEGRWGKNLREHRKRLEASWNQTRLQDDSVGTARDRIVDRYNYEESDPVPPCRGRTPFQTFRDLNGSGPQSNGHSL